MFFLRWNRGLIRIDQWDWTTIIKEASPFLPQNDITRSSILLHGHPRFESISFYQSVSVKRP